MQSFVWGKFLNGALHQINEFALINIANNTAENNFKLYNTSAINNATQDFNLNSFLTLDTNGGRFKQWQAEEYLRFPDVEPGWDMSEAISSFEIVKLICDNSRCRFEVKYNLLILIQCNSFSAAAMLRDAIRKFSGADLRASAIVPT